MRISIYVQDDLHAKLAVFRKGQRISEICQRALWRAVAAEEAAETGDRAARVIARLRQTDEAEVLFARGFEEGRRWAEDVGSWEEILSVRGWSVERINAVTHADHDGFDGIELLDGTDPLRWPPSATPIDAVMAGRLRYDEDAHIAFARGFQRGVTTVYHAVAPAMTLKGRLAEMESGLGPESAETTLPGAAADQSHERTITSGRSRTAKGNSGS